MKLKILFVFLVAIAITAISMVVGLQQYASAAKKVKVTVFFETKCSDTITFFKNVLTPTFHRLYDVMDLDLYAYGQVEKTVNKNMVGLNCQHGPEECAGNTMVCCARKYLSQQDYNTFTMCVLGSRYPPTSGSMCADRLGLDYTAIDKCQRSFEGFQEFLKTGEIQNQQAPNFYWAPWVIINDNFTEKNLWNCQDDLKKCVCETFVATNPTKSVPSICLIP